MCSSVLSLENVQVVAYKRIKAIEIHQPSGPKSGRGSNCKALTGKILVFCIGGRLWEVFAYER